MEKLRFYYNKLMIKGKNLNIIWVLKQLKTFIKEEKEKNNIEYKKDTTLKSAIKNNELLHLYLLTCNIEEEGKENGK